MKNINNKNYFEREKKMKKWMKKSASTLILVDA